MKNPNNKDDEKSPYSNIFRNFDIFEHKKPIWSDVEFSRIIIPPLLIVISSMILALVFTLLR